jgi:polyphosphate kinase
MEQGESRFVNRELSWLEFNHRVLDEARDASIPLLERLKFLAITASNLDEFFGVRVGGLQMLDTQGSSKRDPAGMTARQQLEAISGRVRRMVDDQYTCYGGELEPALDANGIRRLRADDLTDFQLQAALEVFEERIYPVFTPMAIDGGRPLPLLTNQSLHLCCRLRPAPDGAGEPRIAVLPFGRAATRFVTLPAERGYAYMLLEDLVAMNVDRFFPGEEIEETAVFRITRNADLSVREDLASDLLAEMETVLDARKESACVRLEIDAAASPAIRGFLQAMLEVPDAQVYPVRGPVEMAAFMRLTDLSGFDGLRCEPWPPQPDPGLDPRESIFATLAVRDVLLYHPFDSFEPVVRFVEEASEDPDVLSIKQVLYRTSRNSPIVAALKRAAERGKYVTALVELKARFDEARNIEWAKEMERAGVQVIYGVKGLKTHAKVCVVVRQEPQGIRRYVHYGTGNYNESTARLYTDASLMSANEDLGADATTFFNAVCGYSQLQPFRKIEAAPHGLRPRLLALIESERQRKLQGQRAHIIAKFNSLADAEIIDALYAASEAGVKIELNVRGICCLRPGVAGLSENISVISIIDRFLEHSRILYFHHGGDDLVFISSADWMRRNLDKRLELLVPVEDPASRERLMRILSTCLDDSAKGRRILADGGYEPPRAAAADAAVGSQATLYMEACERAKQAGRMQPLVFEPHRSPEAG